jgi:CrcB protein
MEKLILVFVGGGMGSLARYGVGVAYSRAHLIGWWPINTFTVNVLGGVLMGFLVGWLALRGGADQARWQVLLGIGALGGFTTFSSFSLETFNLIDDKGWAPAGLYVVLSVVLAVGGILAGRLLARTVFA